MITKKQILDVLKSILVDYGYDFGKLRMISDEVILNLVCGNKDNGFVKSSKDNIIYCIRFSYYGGCTVMFYDRFMGNSYYVERNLTTPLELRKALINAFKEVGLLTKDESIIKDIIE